MRISTTMFISSDFLREGVIVTITKLLVHAGKTKNRKRRMMNLFLGVRRYSKYRRVTLDRDTKSKTLAFFCLRHSTAFFLNSAFNASTSSVKLSSFCTV